MSGMHSWRELKVQRLEEKLDLRSQPRHWLEFIYEFIGHHWAGPGRGARCDVVIGVAKVLVSASKCLFDSGSDKSYPDFNFAAV